MAQRQVFVVASTFMINGAYVERGAIISNPVDMDFIAANHPEKVTRSTQFVDDAPAPVASIALNTTVAQ